MKIAISMRIVENADYPDSRDALSRDWPQFLQKLFPACVVLPVPNDPRHADRLMAAASPDAVVLSNGNDVGSAPLRDETERVLLQTAIDRKLPVLGVCRGLQFLNTYFSGRLPVDLKQATGCDHANVVHEVTLDGDAFGDLPVGCRMDVNSFHNQGVLEWDLASELTACATSAGGIVEAVRHSRLPLLGVQWHPERSGPMSHFDAAVIARLFRDGTFWLRAPRRSAVS